MRYFKRRALQILVEQLNQRPGWSKVINDADTLAFVYSPEAPSVDPLATLTTPSATAPNINLPGVSFAPLSIVRNGNDFTISGDFPDAAAKASLLDAMRASFGPDVNLIDNANIKAGVNVPDFSGLGSVFDAAVDIPDFNFGIENDTLTLTGTAPSNDGKAAVEAAAAWPNMNVSNEIRVNAAPAPTGAPAEAGAPTGRPAPGPGEACANLQADVNSVLSTPINFDTDGYTLTSGSEQMLTRVASILNACPNAKVAANGYTDNTGNDAINIPFSANRAGSVAYYLVSQGIAADRVTSRGLGSADPVASNDTPDGRTQNPRVEITVS